VTRAEHQAADLVNGLKELGAEIIEMPVIEISPPDSWDELDAAIARLDQYDWVVFASANAVRGFVARIGFGDVVPVPAEAGTFGRLTGSSSSALPGSTPPASVSELHSKCSVAACGVVLPQIAVIGKSTEKAALEAGLTVSYKPDISIAESFVEQFPGYPNLEGKRILWPRTNIGRNYIAEKFTAGGAKVDVVAAYKTCLPANIKELSERLHQLIEKNAIDVIILASAQTANNLAEIIRYKLSDLDQSQSVCRGDAMQRPRSGHLRTTRWVVLVRAPRECSADLVNTYSPKRTALSVNDPLAAGALHAPLQNILIVSIGPETSAGAQAALGKVDLEANPHNASGIIATLVKHFAQNRSKSNQ